LRAVIAAVDVLDLPLIYRSTRCPLLVPRATQSMAEWLGPAAQPGWRAYEAWVRRSLLDAAAETPPLEVAWTGTAHDVPLEAPELVASLIDDRLRGAVTPR
jgi:hypothetical protein